MPITHYDKTENSLQADAYLKNKRKGVKCFGIVSAVSCDLLAGLLIGTAIGYILYRYFSLHLVFFGIFVLLGGLAGLLNMYKTLKRFEKDNKDAPPMLMLTNCFEIPNPILNDLERTQTWDCANSAEILEKCKYQVLANDMLAACLPYKDRADLLVDYIEALVEMFPTCKAVVFDNSKKMFTREAILNCSVPKEQRFIYYAVNARFFNIQGTEDRMVDTLGMSTLFLPDLQYHFHGLNPDDVVNHAYNLLLYIYDNDNPIKPGDHVDGLKDGMMSRDVQWNVQYENSLIQPIREVIDINTGEYASGKR